MTDNTTKFSVIPASFNYSNQKVLQQINKIIATNWPEQLHMCIHRPQNDSKQL